MVVLLMQGLYAVVMLMVALMNAIIVFHIVKYSYSASAKAVTLMLFAIPMVILFMASIALFSNINLVAIFSNF